MEHHAAREMSLEEAAQLTSDLKANVEEFVFGQEELVTETMCALLSGGHILMTGAPGLAKTTLVRVFARYLDLDYGRVQFTPDLLPSDIVGTDVLNVDPGTGRRSFEFSKGPVFTNLMLADEINRASPRTQSALLEAMQERSCTVGGVMHPLPEPFMVFATQNPFESEGTFPLPEAQLDRFLIHALVQYPDEAAEEKILKEHAHSKLVGEQKSLGRGTAVKGQTMNRDMVLGLINCTRRVHVDPELIKIMTALVRSTRPEDEHCPKDLKDHIWYGAGPRAGISLISVARALALIQRSESVRWSHIRKMAKPVLRHRIRLSAQAARDRVTEDKIIEDLLVRIEDRYKNLARGVG